MKVAQVLYSGLGGHGSVAFSLLRAAARDRTWESAMVFVGVEPLLPEYARLCAETGIQYREVRTRQGRGWLSWPELYRALRSLEPDAILLHSVKAILPCTFYARTHDALLVAIEHQNNGLKRPLEWAVSRQSMRWAHAVVTLTEEYRQQMQVALGSGFLPGKVHVIPSGIDTTFFSRTTPAVRSGPIRVGMASRMTAIKRHDLLVDAIAQLLHASPGDSWRLSLAGEGDSLDGLRARARELGISHAVEFPGYLDEVSLRDWFGTLDVYAHATDGETLSTSILQACAMGLPIVASDVEGVSGLLGKGDGIGIVVEQSPSAFAEEFRRLAIDPGLATELGRRARMLVSAEFSQARMFSLYDQLLRC